MIAGRWLLLAALAPLVAGSAAPAASRGERHEERGYVVRAVDGDTLVVRMGRRAVKVRLIGVDTPETVDPRRPEEPFGKEAAAFTRRQVEGKWVVLRGEEGVPNRDQYGRLLRYIFSEDGTLLNFELVAQGYGRVFHKYPFARKRDFLEQERRARERKIGLWAGVASTNGP